MCSGGVAAIKHEGELRVGSSAIGEETGTPPIDTQIRTQLRGEQSQG